MEAAAETARFKRRKQDGIKEHQDDGAPLGPGGELDVGFKRHHDRDDDGKRDPQKADFSRSEFSGGAQPVVGKR